MLILSIPDIEIYDEKNNKFVDIKGTTLHLEHSLLSLTKWEEKYHTSLLDRINPKIEPGISPDEFIYYLKCMTLDKNVDPNVYNYFKYVVSEKEYRETYEYLNDPHSATKMTNTRKEGETIRRPGGTGVTSEYIYYWMTQLNIPFTCEKWNVNRLMTLIWLVNTKTSENNKTNKPKMPRADLYAKNRALNAKRRAQMKSKG